MQDDSTPNGHAVIHDSATFATSLRHSSRETLIDALFEGWSGDYGEGRGRLLARLGEVRPLLPGPERSQVAARLFSVLVELGEDTGDMRLVHLGVETRDRIQFGY